MNTISKDEPLARLLKARDDSPSRLYIKLHEELEVLNAEVKELEEEISENISNLLK